MILALEEAVKNSISKDLTEQDVKEARFLITFSNLSFSFIEYNEEEREVIGDLVIIRDLDKNLIKERIKQGKEFLFKMMDQEEYGFHKWYFTLKDSFEDRLHTVYSASVIYTLLYVSDFEKDEEVLEKLPDMADFLLFMQNKDKQSKIYGAFHYSYYLKNKEKENRFVVGTSALSIFTLLRLHELTANSKYLESAKLAGDWLITMQKSDGSMKPYARYEDEKFYYGKKESLLYNGQVLSALSKLYTATKDKRYHDTAERIARRFAQKYEQENGEYIKGDYREKNPISNSWAVMSLMDFYKSNPVPENNYYKDIVFGLSKKVLENQKKDINDPLNNGQWKGSYSTSGTGWMSEVMVETYKFCKEENKQDCKQYKDAAIKAIRWLIQNTYSEENAFYLKNPEAVIGGLYWNNKTKDTRTDSTCHALNSYILIMNDLEDELLFSLPEKQLDFLGD